MARICLQPAIMQIQSELYNSSLLEPVVNVLFTTAIAPCAMSALLLQPAACTWHSPAQQSAIHLFSHASVSQTQELIMLHLWQKSALHKYCQITLCMTMSR